jgi:hypothetical protein
LADAEPITAIATATDSRRRLVGLEQNARMPIAIAQTCAARAGLSVMNDVL